MFLFAKAQAGIKEKTDYLFSFIQWSMNHFTWAVQWPHFSSVGHIEAQNEAVSEKDAKYSDKKCYKWQAS
jgi:hypothetical protein